MPESTSSELVVVEPPPAAIVEADPDLVVAACRNYQQVQAALAGFFCRDLQPVFAALHESMELCVGLGA